MPSLKKRQPVAVVDGLETHAATRAWGVVRGRSDVPVAIDSFQGRDAGRKATNALVYRLHGVGPGGSNIIAKLCSRGVAEVELRVQRLLPDLPVSHLVFHGSIADDETSRVWLFHEDAGDESWNKKLSSHQLAAARWLGTLHGSAMSIVRHVHLPNRDSTHFREYLRSGTENLARQVERPDLDAEEKSTVHELLEHFMALDADWTDLDTSYREFPATLCHGDFARKNVRVRQGNTEEPRILPFDWETAGVGAPGLDLTAILRDANDPVLTEYGNAARRSGYAVTDDQLRVLASCGRVLHLIAAIYWESESMQVRYRARFATRMQRYLVDLIDAARSLFGPRRAATHVAEDVRTTPIGIERSGSPRLPTTQYLSAVLAQILSPNASAAVLRRDRNVYVSTAPSEVITCQIDDKEPVRIFCKYFYEDIVAANGRANTPFYEINVYREVLKAPVPFPRLYGTFVDSIAGEGWLLLEYLEGSARLVHVRDQESALVAATRWIAMFHRYAAQRIAAPEWSFLRRFDESYFRARLESVLAALHRSGISYLWLSKFEERYDEMCGELTIAPPTVIHAEYYPKNILVHQGHVYPIDWETASIGAGETDLAMLLHNWPDRIVHRCLETYVHERGLTNDHVDRLRDRVAIADVLVNLHWLGYSMEDGRTDKIRLTTAPLVDRLQRSVESLGIA